MNCPKCNTPVDEHKANRCLDEWVATVVLNDPRPLPGDAGILVPYNARLKEHSSEIRAAWMVVEEMRERGWVLTLENECAFDCVHVKFEIGLELDHPIVAHTSRAEAPLAICRAAIKAILNDRLAEDR